MPVTVKKTGALKRRDEQGRPIRDEAPLGPLLTRILVKIDELGEQDAFGYRVLEELMRDSEEWLDPSGVYNSIRKLQGDNKKRPKLIEQSGEGRKFRGPPQKTYRLTALGYAALEATAEYYAGKFALVRRYKKKAHGRAPQET